MWVGEFVVLCGFGCHRGPILLVEDPELPGPSEKKCTAGTQRLRYFDFLMHPLVAQLLPLLPKDFNTRMAILQQLNTTIVQEEFAKQSLQHSQREMVTAQRHADLQQSNGQLLAENNRLKSELHKLDLIRTNVQDITSSSFSNNTTPLDLSELARAPSTSTSAPHLLQQQPRQGQQQQQQQQQQHKYDSRRQQRGNMGVASLLGDLLGGAAPPVQGMRIDARLLQ